MGEIIFQGTLALNWLYLIAATAAAVFAVWRLFSD